MSDTVQVFPVILAGGKGERFWPWSTSKRPKQVLPLVDETPMLLRAIEMARALSKGNVIHIIISGNLHDEFTKELLGQNDVRIVTEPEGRDTAAAVALGAALIRQINHLGVMSILTADHYIYPIEEFAKTFEVAANQAFKGESLLTLGVIPTRPDTGFGYLEIAEKAEALKPVKVVQFVEKPNIEKATEYKASGKYLWNSGMFLWRVDYFWGIFSNSLPEMASVFESNSKALEGSENPREELKSFYGSLQKISIDFGVMEKAPAIECVPVSFGWEDLGSWDALGAVNPVDENNNIVQGNVVNLDTKNSILFSKANRSVVTFGLDNILVAEIDGVTVVANREKIPDLKALVAHLRENGHESLL
ncbi:sugar phosphate nucleotidyltransferase [Fibrobacterales bacterium]|nr:sugar phosphate nucleotidyltransferase [Fibrobacterales bacterium]